MSTWYSQAKVDDLLAALSNTLSNLITGKADQASLSTVATTGAYGDLTNKPAIPATAADVGAVPAGRTVNGYPLSANVSLAKGDVGLSNVDNTADANKSVQSATRLATARTINGQSFDGTANIAIPTSAFPTFACFVSWDGTGSQPVRPVTAAGQPVIYICPAQPTSGGSVTGAGNAVAGLDLWFRTS